MALPAKPQIPEIRIRTPVSTSVVRRSGRRRGGLLLRLLVGLALLDAYLEKVADEHPRLALLLGRGSDGLRRARRAAGDGAGEPAADAAGPVLRRAGLSAATAALRIESSLRAPATMTTAVSFAGS